MIVVISFFLLLILGIPVSLVVLISSVLGIVAFSDISLMLVAEQMFNGLNNFVLLGIPFFIMAGNIAAKGSISGHLINVMRMLLGPIKGGSVIAGICACAFFAAISGSSMATVVAIGTIMIPALIEMGYPEEMAEGSITAGGSIGILIPPSAPMIMICVAMGTSVGKQFMAGFIPGILLAAVWCVYIYFKCKKSNIQDTKVYTKEEKKEIWKKSIWALLYPFIVLGGIYFGFATPTEAAAIALIYVILIEVFVYKTLTRTDCPRGLRRAQDIRFYYFYYFLRGGTQLADHHTADSGADLGYDRGVCQQQGHIHPDFDGNFLYSRLFHGFDCIDRNFRTDPRAHVVNFQHRPDPVRHYVRDVCTDFLYYSAVRPEPVRDHGYAQADHDA